MRVHDHVPGTDQAPPWASFPVEEAGPGDRQSPILGGRAGPGVWGPQVSTRGHGTVSHGKENGNRSYSQSQCYGEARFCFIFLVKEENMNLQEDRVCSLCPDAGWLLPDGQPAGQGGGARGAGGTRAVLPAPRPPGCGPSDKQLAGRQTGNPPARPRPGNGSSHLCREEPRPHIPAKIKT